MSVSSSLRFWWDSPLPSRWCRTTSFIFYSRETTFISLDKKKNKKKNRFLSFKHKVQFSFCCFYTTCVVVVLDVSSGDNLQIICFSILTTIIHTHVFILLPTANIFIFIYWLHIHTRKIALYIGSLTSYTNIFIYVLHIYGKGRKGDK